MISRMIAVACFGWVAGSALCRPAEAGQPYQGIYVVVDPYAVADVQSLRAAAATPCPATVSATPTAAFCGAVDGILLRTGWCNFEPDHASAGPGAASCHYILGYSNGAGSPARQLPVASGAEYTTPCQQNFDICSAAGTGSLGNVLGLIAQINANRAATRSLAPLKLSVGLEAGIWTPQSVLASVGTVDVAHNTTSTGDPNATQCYRLPQVWQPAYVQAYDGAVDQLLGFITAQLGGQPNIVILKAAGIVADDLEIEMPGAPNLVAAPGPDPLSPSRGMGPPIACSATVAGAQVWLNAYARAPQPSLTYAQAVETSFGAIIGHADAALAEQRLGALISIATTNASAFADVNCGLSGAAACTVSTKSGDWARYYLAAYMNDLFNGGIAGRAAAGAYAAVLPNTAMDLPPQAVSVNWTALSATPIVPSSQATCALNNTVAANDPVLVLDGVSQQIAGVGTTIGWQTQVQQGSLCAASPHDAYSAALANGIAQGGQFIEVEGDAAFTHAAACGPDLAAASQQLRAQLQSSCQF
jgi:hypothetical protein